MSDSRSRQAIVNSEGLKKNMLVRASAGSGKTTILVERLVALIESGVAIDKIVAITFTKKAANEFYERLYHKLELRSSDNFSVSRDDEHSLLNDPKPEQKVLDKKALQYIDNCFLGTIDSFVQTILNEHPIDANIPASSQIIDEEEEKAVLIALYRKMINDNLFNLAIEAKAFNALVGAKDFPQIIKNVLDSRNYTPVMESSRLIQLENRFNNDLNTFIAGLNDLLKAVNNDDVVIAKNQASKEAYEYLFNRRYVYSHLGSSRYNYRRKKYYLSKLKKLEFIDENNKLASFTSLCVAGKKSKKFAIGDLLVKQIDDITYEIAMPFLIKASQAISDYFRAQGILTYKEAMIHAVELLRKDDNQKIKVIASMQNKYAHYLLDECQDTDSLQYELFFRLCAKTPNEDWRKLLPEPGSLFLVGDRKQSIYHFRGADVNVYDLVEQLFTNGVGEIIDLTSNFRSDVKLCEYFNTTFKTFGEHLNYLDIPANGCKRHDGFTGVYKYNSDNEHETVAKAIKLIHQEMNIDYKDFMVITASKKKLTDYLSAFSKADIPYFSEGLIDFTASPLLIGVCSLFKVMINPSDNYHKILLFGSPLFNFDLTKTIDLSFNYLDALHLTFSPNQSASSIVEQLAGNEAIINQVGYQGFDILVALISLLKEAEMAGKINSLYEASLFIDELENDSDIERVSLLSNAIDAVRVANLHKVKGLEAKVVILTKAGKMAKKNYAKHCDLANNKVYFFSFEGERNEYNDSKPLLFTTSLYHQENGPYMAEDKYDQAEESRLLYVAATRAKDILLISEPTSYAKKWEPLLSNIKVDDIANVIKSTKTPKVTPSINLKTVVNPNNIVIDQADNLTKSTYAIMNGSTELKVINPMDDSPIEDETTLKKDREQALLFGTMVHQLLEDIVNAKEHPLPISICEAITQEYAASEDLAKRLIDVYQKIYNGGYSQIDNAITDIYQLAKNNACLTETPYALIEEKTVHYGVIDLIIFLKDEIYVIDYKTDAKDIDHSSQLKAYANVLKKRYPNKEVKTFIYHIR